MDGGNVGRQSFLSTCHSYLGLFRSHGQRVFIETDGGWKLLAMPSAFDMHPDSCRWIYKHCDGVIEVISSAPDDSHELRLAISVLDGASTRFLISHHVPSMAMTAALPWIPSPAGLPAIKTR